MADAPISPDSPEVRLLCQLAGLAPSRLVAALSDSSKHISPDERAKLLGAIQRLIPLVGRINTALLGAPPLGSYEVHLTKGKGT